MHLAIKEKSNSIQIFLIHTQRHGQKYTITFSTYISLGLSEGWHKIYLSVLYRLYNLTVLLLHDSMHKFKINV